MAVMVLIRCLVVQTDTLVGGGGADVAVFTGPKGSHTFGIDEPSGLLTVTSKETGSVDTIDSIETLAFDVTIRSAGCVDLR